MSQSDSSLHTVEPLLMFLLSSKMQRRNTWRLSDLLFFFLLWPLFFFFFFWSCPLYPQPPIHWPSLTSHGHHFFNLFLSPPLLSSFWDLVHALQQSLACCDLLWPSLTFAAFLGSSLTFSSFVFLDCFLLTFSSPLCPSLVVSSLLFFPVLCDLLFTDLWHPQSFFLWPLLSSPLLPFS